MKKILIVTHWYYPRSVPRAFRAKELVDELNRKGYKVDILVGDYKEKFKASELSKITKEKIKFNKNSRYSNNYLLQKIKKISEYFIGERFLISSGTYIYKNLDIANYDVIISIGLPFYIHLVTAIKIKVKKFKGISIADWSDPFYKSNIKVAPYFRYLQKFTCTQFSFNVSPTKKTESYFSEYTNKKIEIIPQGFNFEKIKINNYTPNEITKFGYAGIFYEDIRNPEKLLEALTKINKDFVFVLFTIDHGAIYQKVLLKYKEILGNKLEIYGLIPREECIQKMSQFDFLINLDNVTQNQVPSKLIDYTLTKRPILTVPSDKVNISELKKFLSGDYSKQTVIDINSFDIKNVVKKFIDLIENGEKNGE